MASGQSSSETPIQCQFCSESFSNEREMRDHYVICASKTERCQRCKKYILRSIFAYHTDNNCADLNLTNEVRIDLKRFRKYFSPFLQETKQTRVTGGEKFDSLFASMANIHLGLSENHYPNVVSHVTEKVKFNIVIMGSPRVGKSQLINAFCDGQQRAETSASLDSCTKEIIPYVFEDDQQRHPNVKPFRITFYDTPGIESWTNEGGKMTMHDFIKETDPVCMIYCASPGCFASLAQLHSILQYCRENEIFCALVCTNMWSGNQRSTVINEFHRQLAFFGQQIDRTFNQTHPPSPHRLSFFGQGALCTMVNSFPYSDQELFGDEVKPVRGVDELIQGIMEVLDHEKLLGWCYAVLERRTFWQKISQNVDGFVQQHWMNFQNLEVSASADIAEHVVRYLYEKIFQKSV